ncbi:hypothetical protein EHQ83_17590 [Leptospira yasudae]|uniref:Uncharacterized protein n=1 Tax=Leptospira yasudae TaxID=2202201 RepID=A0A6N4QXT7_9LEPT|nr:hypothetical protein EHQ77_13295 [Leptospira yasudae]TGL79869.1 hypothetical protein EHQ72_08460 [Leptospira yasudae]TGL79910.1 hypothetical protein EHQ83_17590 [Leptospira yasudae]
MAIEIKIVSLRNRFSIDLVIGRFFYFRENLQQVPKLSFTVSKSPELGVSLSIAPQVFMKF